jgi:hypothetical protein
MKRVDFSKRQLFQASTEFEPSTSGNVKEIQKEFTGAAPDSFEFQSFSRWFGFRCGRRFR